MEGYSDASLELKFLFGCFGSSVQVSIVFLSKELEIISFNHGFSQLFHKDFELKGRSLQSFLLPESQKLIAGDIWSTPDPFKLHFDNSTQSPTTLNCAVVNVAGGCCLVGENSVSEDINVVERMSVLNAEMAALTRELNRKNRELEQAKKKIKTLSGIIPICAYCKEIRNDAGYWNRLEEYIESHSEAQFSHGICDRCMEDRLAKHLKK